MIDRATVTNCSLWVWGVILGLGMPGGARAIEPVPDPAVLSMEILRESGGRVDWSKATDRLVYDRLGDDGYYDIHVMNPDGTGEACLTCGKDGLVPQRHNGNPSWHPSGEYIVFQCEREEHPGLSSESKPGFGRHSELWLASADGSRFDPLTGLETPSMGVLHPHFSRDGKLLTWSRMLAEPDPSSKTKAFGLWELVMADFAVGPRGPVLSRIRSFQPGGPAFYENHGLSPDNRRWLFTSNSVGGGPLEVVSNDVYVWEVGSNTPVVLATEKYDEHAQWSPNGRLIAWMSGADNSGGGSDYWLIHADGTRRMRLTHLNNPDDPALRGRRMTVADCAWSPDGSRLVGYAQTDLFKQTGMLLMFHLHPAIAAQAAD